MTTEALWNPTPKIDDRPMPIDRIYRVIEDHVETHSGMELVNLYVQVMDIHLNELVKLGILNVQKKDSKLIKQALVSQCKQKIKQLSATNESKA